MEKLNNDWLTDGLIDFEYKKYVLLAYFKKVRASFQQQELYPILGDLVFHYNNLLQFKNNHELIQQNFPKELTGVDLKKLELTYQKIVEDDELMSEIEEIIAYALPLFKGSLSEGKEIYEFVESNCELTPVGLLPLYTDEGYFFISHDPSRHTRVYRYQLTLLETSDEKYRGIHATLVDKLRRGIGDTYENIKIGLTRRFKDLPNPATFLIHSKVKFPYTSTLEPVAKRLLVRYISSS
ncbi:hypothetical protein C900_05123 [Fulvivirga imtechensis AK7]|uniref:Uncharacterized protein n=1 Tax=Fulvivirga imtechensis AK7 TaxID=1237149 RepID=L8JMA5_9BACT|nr:hypothetical protein [Fulvivirga imtechensis]ELR69343.1 hypothetical protein C900_05123 [Fulvivirga imtechensis AK7]